MTSEDFAIVSGGLAFLVGAVWLPVAIHRSWRRLTPALIALLGLLATNTGGISYLDNFYTPSGSTPVLFIMVLLVLLGVLGLLAGMVWAVLSRLRRRSFYAPGVLAGLAIVAILQAGVLNIEQPDPPKYPHGLKDAEQERVQTAMESLMADLAIVKVEPPPANTAQNNFIALPKYGGTAFLGGNYMQDVITTFFYCWNEAGRLTGQYDSAQQCP